MRAPRRRSGAARLGGVEHRVPARGQRRGLAAHLRGRRRRDRPPGGASTRRSTSTGVASSATPRAGTWRCGRPGARGSPPGAPGSAPAVRACARGRSPRRGVCDLAGAYSALARRRRAALMGGGPEELPERYAAGDPLRLLPPSMPVLLVHGTSDETVSVELSRSYAELRRAAGRRGGAGGDRGRARGATARTSTRAGRPWAAVHALARSAAGQRLTRQAVDASG